MRIWFSACAVLTVSILVGAATSAEAAIISFSDVHDPTPDITLTVGGTESYTYTHDLADAGLTIPPDQVLTGTLAIVVSDPGGAENVLFRFDLGTLLNLGNTGASTTYSFDLADSWGGTVLIDSLNADGTLEVTVGVGQQGGPASSFVFQSSTLSGRAEVAQVPEPASLLMLGGGILGSLVVRRVRRRAAP